MHPVLFLVCKREPPISLRSLYVWSSSAAGIILRKYDSRINAGCSGDAAVLVLLGGFSMAARADNVSRVDHDGVTLVEGATSDVRFAFTERTGGVSEDVYSSLNLGSHVGDDPFAVQENRRRALEAMGAIECEHNLLVPNQVHGDHIVTVTSNGADDLEDCSRADCRGLRCHRLYGA